MRLISEMAISELSEQLVGETTGNLLVAALFFDWIMSVKLDECSKRELILWYSIRLAGFF